MGDAEHVVEREARELLVDRSKVELNAGIPLPTVLIPDNRRIRGVALRPP